MSPDADIGTGKVAPDRNHAAPLAKREADSKLALEAAGVGTWTWEIAADALVWDAFTHKLFGVTPGEFGGRGEEAERFIHHDDRRRVRAAVARCIQDGNDFSCEYRVVWPNDGSTHFLRARGKVYRDAEGRAIQMTGA